MSLPQLSAVPFQTELYRRNPRHYVKLLGWGGKSPGASVVELGGRWQADTGLSSGASLVCNETELDQVAIQLAGNYNISQSRNMWKVPAIIAWTEMEVENAINPLPADRHNQAGIRIGAATTEINDNPNGPTVKLYARNDTNPSTFEVSTARGSGAATTFTPLTGVGTLGHFVSCRLMLIYTPAAVFAFVNGVLGATVTGASLPDGTIDFSDQGVGVYVQCSANANDETVASFCGFSAERVGRP